MGRRILVAGECAELGRRLAQVFLADGHEVACSTGTAPPPLDVRGRDLCVTFWKEPQRCPVELMRDYQAENPQGYLMCCSAKPDPGVRSFLTGAGVTPDLVVSGPISEAEILSEAKRLLALERGGGGEHVIICVDDDKDFLLSLEQALPGRVAAHAPFETSFEFLSRPEEAVKMLGECGGAGTPVAMVLTDHLMPGVTGVELLGRAKTLAPLALRVLLTGQAGLESVVTAVNNRTLDHYFAKPVVDLDQFAQSLVHLLREYHLLAKSRLDSWQIDEQYQFLKNLTRLDTLDETLRAVVSFVSLALEAERVSLMLCDGDRLTIRASLGVPEEVVAATAVPIGAGIAGRVFATGLPLYVEDRAQLEIDSEVETSCSVFASVPLLVAPMTVAAAPVGIINVTNRRGDRPLTRGDILFLSHVADAAAIAISGHIERERRELANFGAVRSLALALEAKDRYTRGHSERVALYSVRMAERLGLRPQEITDLERAAVMHDVGKIGVPEQVIHKPGSLTEAEFECIRQHPITGERIVSQLSFMARSLPIVRSHHERLDGRGYPDGLAGDDIPLCARIVAVADAYDAMISERPYRRAMDSGAAVAELRRCAGTQVDGRCVAALVQILAEEPREAANVGEPASG